MALNGESNSKEIINSETQAAEAARLRAELLDLLRRGQVFRTAAVEQAFASVPRENFLPATIPLSKVYIDDAIPVKYNDEGMATSSSSQPYLMADMLEVLHLRPGLKVLEIGAGVGYNAALMAHILGDGELVTTIDLDPDMAQYARENLQRLGPPYSAITVVAADGALGYPPNAPYDRIIVTVQQWEISPYWVEQLKPGGLLELPISISPHVWGGLLPCFRKEEDGTLTAIDASNGGFMPMRGEMEHPLSRRENQLHQRLVKTALPPPILLPPYYYNKELSLYLSLEEWLEPYIPLLQDTNVFQDKNGLLSRDLLEPASQLYRDWALNHGQGRDWSRISEQQREALNKSTGFNLLLAAVCAGNGNIASVFTGQPATEENRSPFAFEKDGQRYEWRGLVVGAPAGEQSLDLALVIGTEPVIGWRVGDSVLSGNSALSLVAQIWEDWWKMGQPQSSDYRPVAYPAETTPRMPGYAVKRRFYDLFLPLD